MPPSIGLGLDVSGSVDGREYRLQLDGLASALGDADVREALLGQPESYVRITVYEWSDPQEERMVVPWMNIDDEFALLQLQARLRATQRADMGPSTGLGSAMEFGFYLLEQQTDCWTRTLDISGDGKGNTGRRPQDVETPPTGITVNGLVVGVDDGNSGHERNLQIGELTAYFNAYVIRGPDAFVETALGFEDYGAAMRRKLLRELTTLAIGQLAEPPSPPRQ